MFRTPVTTIRDVAELTNISPKVIGRILADIRGPSDVEQLGARLDAYEQRLKNLEGMRYYPPAPMVGQTTYQPQMFVSPDQAQVRIWETYQQFLERDRQTYFNNTNHTFSKVTFVGMLPIWIGLIILFVAFILSSVRH
ncbi:MAG: hypothetical protein JST12_08225 [Armatimonadetes bacterium]|nr:hypothetical protein [Armatimonadota bacterium]